MNDLTPDEMRRIQQTIRRRYPADPCSNILAVGFGPADKNGESDPNRPFAACYYVKKKKATVPKAQRIPKELSVRVKRGKTFVTLTIRTDVVETPRFAPSSRFVTDTGVRIGSAGMLVTWKRDGEARAWGIVTAGHLFAGGQTTAALKADLLVGTTTIPVDVFQPSAADPLLDVALLEITPGMLNLAGLKPPTVPPPQAPFWSEEELTAAFGPNRTNAIPGVSLRPENDDPKFVTKRYFPKSDDLIPTLGNLSNIVHVRGTSAVNPAPFIPGTSGSAWTIQGRAAAVQVGRNLASSPTAGDENTEGLAQFLHTQLKWIEAELTKAGALTDFRFAGAF